MISITLGKSDITAEEMGDRIKITFNQECKVERVQSLIKGGFCHGHNNAMVGNAQEKFNPEMRAPYSKIDMLIKGAVLSDLLKKPFISNGPMPGEFRDDYVDRVRRTFGFKELFNHDPSFVYVAPKFTVNQTVYFFGQDGRIWDGVIKEVSKNEALVQGKDITWIPLELLFTSLEEAYVARDKEEVEAKERADAVNRIKSFKIGQDVYVVIKNEFGAGILKGGLIDIGEYEAEVKIPDHPSNRCVFNAKNVFHTMQEANDRASFITIND